MAIKISRIRYSAAVAAFSFLAASAQARVPSTGLVGYWTGNGNADDSSSTGNNGTFGGSYVAGPSTGSSAFDLSTGGVTIPDISAYQISSSSSFTVGFWFNLNGNTGAQDIIGQDIGSGTNPKWFIDYNYLDASNFEFLAGPQLFTIGGPAAPSSAGWHQLTLTVSGGVYDFYLDGVDEGSVAGYGPGYAWPDPDAPLQFSFLDGGKPYAGDLADVVIYNRALSASEVGQLANIEGVPEPSTWTLALLGLGGLGVRLRRLRTIESPAVSAV